MLEEDNQTQYSWEKGYEKSWETLEEGDTGLFAPIALGGAKKRKDETLGRLGMIRNLTLILDCSECMLDQDLKPSRQLCCQKLLQDFINQFLDSNSISQLGIVITRNKRAEKISDLTGNVTKLLESLKKCEDPSYCKGEPSLQNALELAETLMRSLPTYSSKEILVISGNLTLVDPGNIQNTIEEMKNSGIKCSVIGLSAEMYIYKALCNATGGDYDVVLHDHHFQQILMKHVKPHSVSKNCVATCVRMGFCSSTDTSLPYTACMCHLDDRSKLNAPGFFCPQCRAKCCELPSQCKVCGISLATSAHLTRPLHYLVSLPPFIECADLSGTHKCKGCLKTINADSSKVLSCEQCHQLYCEDCDEYIHNDLYICPGCAAVPIRDT